MKLVNVLRRCLAHLAHTTKRDPNDWFNPIYVAQFSDIPRLSKKGRGLLVTMLDRADVELRKHYNSEWQSLTRPQQQEARFDMICTLIELELADKVWLTYADFGKIIATTIANRSKIIAQNVTAHNALLNHLKAPR